MDEFDFDEPKNLGVYVCRNVLDHAAPVLSVSHDADGDWQFLCGGQHGEDSEDGGALVCLEEVVRRDPTLNELADLCPLGEAERISLGSAWRVHDRMEDIVRDNVREHGCHVMTVAADDVGPGFAYSIGLSKTYGQPELICFGLKSDLMHSMINELSARMGRGERVGDGKRVSELIEGYDCVLRTMDKRRYREYLGYARWFYNGDGFDVLQIVWPDKQANFPWEPNCTVEEKMQPRTWKSASPG